MSATVGAARGIVHEDDVVTGRAVRAQTWLTAAQLLNWSGGRGDVLVPAYTPLDDTIKPTETKTYSYRVTPSGRAVRRVWVISLSGNGELRITPGSAAYTSISATEAPSTFVVIEDLTAKSGSTQTLTLVIGSGTGSHNVVISSIACYEAPRPSLDTADYGIDLLTEMARAPIDERDNSSLGGIVEALANETHRRHYLAFARPEENYWSTTSTSYSTVLTGVVILTRKIYPSSTTGDVRWYAYVKTSAATTGTIEFVGPGGSVVTVTIPANAAWSWVTVDQTGLYPCEDLSTADGLTGGTWSTCDVLFKRASGAGTVYVASICAEEV